MSWLSKALKNNSVKIGLVLAGATIGKEYFYGDYAVSNPYEVEAFGEAAKYEFTGNNLTSSFLNTLKATPFKETGVGKSFIGKALDYMEPLKGDSTDLALKGLRANMGLPQAPVMEMTAGSQSFRGMQGGFEAGRTQLLSMGNNGRALAALNNANTQQYLAGKIQGLNIPGASPLPSLNTGAGSIQTTSMRRRGYKKLGLSA
jgi:hypothetical protein